MSDPMEYHVTEQSPGVYAVVFRTAGGLATITVPVELDGRTQADRQKGDLQERSVAGLRARNIAQEFVDMWDGK